MIKILFGLLFVSSLLFSASKSIEVTADHFEADDAKHTSLFSGNVKIVKGYDSIASNKLVINFDKKRKPTKYIATGKANFKLFLNGKHYSGKADKIIYDPVKKIYHFIGNAYLNEIEGNKKIYGDDIYVDQTNGKYSVKSNGKKPVKFIFDVKDK